MEKIKNIMRAETVKFGVFSDLHLDIMHDGESRFQEFMEAMEHENVDFIIQLGDFCYPEDTEYCACSPQNMPVNLKNSLHMKIDVPKMELLAKFNAFEKPAYHVLGNHEFDFCTKEKALSLYGMKRRYYSFESKGWKFMVLDGNHYRDSDGVIRDYRYGDYFDSADLPYIDEEQMRWIGKELKGSAQPVVIFSHQPLTGEKRGIRNADELLHLFEEVNRKERRVYLCMNGHTHLDKLECREGIFYYTVNSMSNHWMGSEYACRRYDEETERRFPNLQYVLPYEEPVFAVVTLDSQGMTVKGREGSFVRPGAEAWGLEEVLSPSISDRKAVWPIRKSNEMIGNLIAKQQLL